MPNIVRAGNTAISVSFFDNLDALSKRLHERYRRQLPYVTMRALNDTAFKAMDAERRKILRAFDRPTPYIQRSVRVDKATKQWPTARVHIETFMGKGIAPAKVLRAEVKGGPRRHKRFERALILRGLMRMDEYAIPAIGQRRDQYGNVPGGLITRMLAQLKALDRAGSKGDETERSRKRNKRARAERFFVSTGEGKLQLPRGVYARRGKKLRAVFMFVSAPNYRRRYAFGQPSLKVAQREFVPALRRHLLALEPSLPPLGSSALRLRRG